MDTLIQLENRARQELGWNNRQIAMASQSDIVAALERVQHKDPDRFHNKEPEPVLQTIPEEQKNPEILAMLPLQRSRATTIPLEGVNENLVIDYQLLKNSINQKEDLLRRTSNIGDMEIIQKSLKKDILDLNAILPDIQQLKNNLLQRIVSKKEMLRLCDDIMPAQKDQQQNEIQYLSNILSEIAKLV